MSVKVCLIIPAFNEEEALPKLLKEILAAGVSAEHLVVVNDGSSDKTATVATSHGVPVVDLVINLGIGGAVQAGYQWAMRRGFDGAIQVDGDGQHPISSVLALVAEWKREPHFDLIIGSRFVGDQRSNYTSSSPLRLVGIRWLSALASVITGQRLADTTSGLRLASRRLMSEWAVHYPTDYPEPESLVWAVRQGFQVKEIPVTMRERQGGESSIRLLRSIYYFFKVSTAMALCLLNRKLTT